MRTIETSLLISKCEEVQEYRKWAKELPTLHFEKEWDVKIIPPFAKAIIRFTIDYNGKHVSVYFDGYSELGYMIDDDDEPIPYWEYYDGKDCHRYYMEETEQMMRDIKNFLEN